MTATGWRARIPALAGFAVFGVFWGSWGAVLPAVQERAKVSEGELGLALLLIGLGALGSMRLAGVLIDRFGSVTGLLVVLFGVTALGPALATGPVGLMVALLLVGVTSGAVDVAVNAEGVRYETETGRRLLNLGHACFSIAVVAASLLTGVLRGTGGGAPLVLGLVAAIVVAVGIFIRLAAAPGQPAPPRQERERALRRPPGWLLLLGVLCALAYWVENTWQSWSAIHLERTLAAPAGVSALGPAAFAVAAAAGRLAGHRLVGRFGDRALIAAGAVVAAAGTLLAAVAPSTAVALAGILLAGMGTSVIAPTILSLAGAAAPESERGAAVSTVTTIAYLGFLVGPAAVGGLTSLAGLRTALASTGGLAILLAGLVLIVRLPARRERAVAGS
jgi:MFS family permease